MIARAYHRQRETFETIELLGDCGEKRKASAENGERTRGWRRASALSFGMSLCLGSEPF